MNQLDFTFNPQFIYYLTYLDEEDQTLRQVICNNSEGFKVVQEGAAEY